MPRPSRSLRYSGGDARPTKHACKHGVRVTQLSSQRAYALACLGAGNDLPYDLASHPLAEFVMAELTRLTQTIVTNPGNGEFP